MKSAPEECDVKSTVRRLGRAFDGANAATAATATRSPSPVAFTRLMPTCGFQGLIEQPNSSLKVTPEPRTRSELIFFFFFFFFFF